MVFAILFVVSFLLGAGIYFFSNANWRLSVVAPLLLFVVALLIDPGSVYGFVFSLSFGSCIVFFAALLGCYVVETRSQLNEGQGEKEEATESNDA